MRRLELLFLAAPAQALLKPYRGTHATIGEAAGWSEVPHLKSSRTHPKTKVEKLFTAYFDDVENDDDTHPAPERGLHA